MSCIHPIGLFSLRKNFFDLYIILTREVILCPNILNAVRKFARVFKLCSFHETKQTQIEVERFFYNLAEFIFENLHDSRRILASFAKFFLKALFATWSYRYPNPKRVIQRALALPSLFHPCPAPNCYSASGINSRQFGSVRKLGDFVRVRKTASRGRGLFGKRLPPLSILYVNQKYFCTARNGLGTSLAP